MAQKLIAPPGETDKPVSFYLSRPSTDIKYMFERHGFTHVEDQEEADLVVFGGGADINPFLYGMKRHQRTHVDYNLDLNDIRTLRNCNEFQSLIGICRGAQFLNVMVGNGWLYQHVDNHANGNHLVYEMDDKGKRTGRTFKVSSTHHQMMVPGPNATVLGVAQEAMVKYTFENEPRLSYTVTDRMDYFDDYEVILYNQWPYTALCFQPHPEIKGKDNEDTARYFFDLIHRHILTPKQSDHVQYEQLAREM